MEAFRKYSWPGNVRELRNVLERAVIMAGERAIQMAHLPTILVSRWDRVHPRRFSNRRVCAFRWARTVGEAEKALIQLTLQHTKNNKTRAAEILGISLKTLFNKLKEYGASDAGEAGA